MRDVLTQSSCTFKSLRFVCVRNTHQTTMNEQTFSPVAKTIDSYLCFVRQLQKTFSLFRKLLEPNFSFQRVRQHIPLPSTGYKSRPQWCLSSEEADLLVSRTQILTQVPLVYCKYAFLK